MKGKMVLLCVALAVPMCLADGGFQCIQWQNTKVPLYFFNAPRLDPAQCNLAPCTPPVEAHYWRQTGRKWFAGKPQVGCNYVPKNISEQQLVVKQCNSPCSGPNDCSGECSFCSLLSGTCEKTPPGCLKSCSSNSDCSGFCSMCEPQSGTCRPPGNHRNRAVAPRPDLSSVDTDRVKQVRWDGTNYTVVMATDEEYNAMKGKRESKVDLNSKRRRAQMPHADLFPCCMYADAETFYTQTFVASGFNPDYKDECPMHDFGSPTYTLFMDWKLECDASCAYDLYNCWAGEYRWQY